MSEQRDGGRVVAAVDALGRGVFLAVAASLMAFALAMLGWGWWTVLASLFSGGQIARSLLEALGWIVIGLAVFDVSKYLMEEEILRDRELREPAEARKSLTKFVSTISIAVFLEALVAVFDAVKSDLAALLWPTLLLVAGMLMVVGLGLYQRLSMHAEQKEIGR
jgi:N-glycosylase/DNA lyase